MDTTEKPLAEMTLAELSVEEKAIRKAFAELNTQLSEVIKERGKRCDIIGHVVSYEQTIGWGKKEKTKTIRFLVKYANVLDDGTWTYLTGKRIKKDGTLSTLNGYASRYNNVKDEGEYNAGS